MFHDKMLKKVVDVGFKNDTFQLLPAISITNVGGYLEIVIGFLTFYIYICYSFENIDGND